MNGLAEVISLDSRRNRRNRRDPRPETAAPSLTTVTRRRRLAAFCVAMVALVTGLMLIDQSALPHAGKPSVASLSSELRQGLYQRAVGDISAGCAVPEARTGLLRQHCVEQAKFLAALPECTGDCVRLTDAVLSPRR
jgi:hypothetical protein